jgi:hypothetical protein
MIDHTGLGLSRAGMTGLRTWAPGPCYFDPGFRDNARRAPLGREEY